MTVIYLLVPIALVMGLGFLALFIWNAKSDQYDDLVTPAIRILDNQPLGKETSDE